MAGPPATETLRPPCSSRCVGAQADMPFRKYCSRKKPARTILTSLWLPTPAACRLRPPLRLRSSRCRMLAARAWVLQLRGSMGSLTRLVRSMAQPKKTPTERRQHAWLRVPRLRRLQQRGGRRSTAAFRCTRAVEACPLATPKRCSPLSGRVSASAPGSAAHTPSTTWPGRRSSGPSSAMQCARRRVRPRRRTEGRGHQAVRRPGTSWFCRRGVAAGVQDAAASDAAADGFGADGGATAGQSAPMPGSSSGPDNGGAPTPVLR